MEGQVNLVDLLGETAPENSIAAGNVDLVNLRIKK